MQHTPFQPLHQFAHILQQELFPSLEAELGPLSPSLRLLASIVALTPLDRLLHARRARTGRPAKDRTALAIAFLAKAVLNLPTTRSLIDRLRADRALRETCGWLTTAAMPHEAKFSRAFAEFALTNLPQHLHEALIRVSRGERLVGHIARDSTAIPVRERIPAAQPVQPSKDKPGKDKKPLKQTSKSKTKAKGSKRPFRREKAADRGTRIQQQRHEKLDTMLARLPCQCDFGVKKNSKGKEQFWPGYKLHLDVADGQIPVSAILTSASVHDSQVAIPLMTLTSGRVQYLYELMDSAYDAEAIHEHSRQLNHVPIIAIHPRRGTKQPSQCPKAIPPVPTPELTWAQKERFKIRTMIERVNARLKDEFGGSQIRVRGAAKVMAHLMFGIVALTADQVLRITG